MGRPLLSPRPTAEEPLHWQGSLLSASPPEIDPRLDGAVRHRLDAHSWVDLFPGWLRGSDAVFADLVAHAPWAQRTMPMYGEVVSQPRLTSHWTDELARQIPVVESARRALSRQYGVTFDSIWMNLYRNGDDSVAWHGDRVAREIAEPVVAILALGQARPFRARPRGGGPSLSWSSGRGDLLVTGGRFHRDWEHTIAKQATSGPRISVTFRHSARPVA